MTTTATNSLHATPQKSALKPVARHKYEGTKMITDKLADSDPEVYKLMQLVRERERPFNSRN